MCLRVKPCTRSSKQNEVSGKKQPDESAFCLSCKPGSGLPHGSVGVGGRQQEYNMRIRPHNIIYNRQTHFHTNGFHRRGSTISINVRGCERGGERERERGASLLYGKYKGATPACIRNGVVASCSLEASRPLCQSVEPTNLSARGKECVCVCVCVCVPV